MNNVLDQDVSARGLIDRAVPLRPETYPGHERSRAAAGLGRGLAGRAASPELGVLVPDDLDALLVAMDCTVRPIAPTLTDRTLHCVTWIGALVFAMVSIAQALAACGETASQNVPVGTAMATPAEPGSVVGDARPGSRSAHQRHKRFHKFPKIMLANDPNDDGTSSDPDDDDDASDDLSCDDETDGPILASFHELPLYLIAAEAPSPAPADFHSSPFLMPLRLRC
jgi:hypothetical protein